MPELDKAFSILAQVGVTTLSDPGGLSGRHGQIFQRYREGQENQLGPLGLVLNARVLEHQIHRCHRHGTA